ncbi:MAG: SDR family NAD(P)-dependent oxidoreductase, partial [Pseudomonadota bacterium]
MKTVLVTGASDGIGRETARQISEKRHQVFIHGRSLEKAAKTAADLAQTVPDARLIPVYADLSDMHQVLDLAKQVRDKTAVLDVLINNAGVFEERRTVTRDGFEMTMAVNHFAHFLLSLQLLDLLKAAPQGRIITVSSIAHGMGTIDLNDLTFKHHYSGYDAYAVSKLANILFTMALGARLTGTPVTANSLHPG